MRISLFTALICISFLRDVTAAPLPGNEEGTGALVARVTPANAKAPVKVVAKKTVARPLAKVAKPIAAKKPVAAKVPAKKAPVAKKAPTAKTSATVAKGKTAAIPAAKGAVAAKGTTAKAAPVSCPIRPKTKATAATKATPVKKVTARALEYFRDVQKLSLRDLFVRAPPAGSQFIGWHGTNSKTAEFWTVTNSGKVLKPPPGPKGFVETLFDFEVKSGTAGGDAELGEGLYLTDGLGTAAAASTFNAKNNQGTTPSVCAIFAANGGNWDRTVHKVLIPPILMGDNTKNPGREDLRLEFMTTALRQTSTTTAKNSVKVSVLHKPVVKNDPNQGLQSVLGQILIPVALNPLLHAECFDVNPTTLTSAAAEAANFGNFPAFSYLNNGGTVAQWGIVRPPAPATLPAAPAPAEGDCVVQ